MTSERQCYVYIVLPGETRFVTAGRFQTSNVDGVAIGGFVYRRAYRERTDAVELDPVELHLVAGLFETARMDGFFGVIRDAMPDYWGRLALERQRGGPLEEFDYLLQGPDDRAGALGFGLALEAADARWPFSAAPQLAALQRHAEAVLAGHAGPPSAHESDALFGSTSMGGARPKAVVEDDGALWLAKFSRSDDRWNQPRVEAGMLALAMTCGKFGRVASRENLVSASGRFFLSSEDAGAIFDQVLRTVRARWRPLLKGAGVSAADCDALAGAFAYPGLTSRQPME